AAAWYGKFRAQAVLGCGRVSHRSSSCCCNSSSICWPALISTMPPGPGTITPALRSNPVTVSRERVAGRPCERVLGRGSLLRHHEEGEARGDAQTESQ